MFDLYGDTLTTVPEFGQLALILAFVMAVFQSIIPFVGVQKRDALLMAWSRPLAAAQALFLTISLVVLGYCFVIDDFSVTYVATNSNTALPTPYKISAVWGAHEGSLLLWVTMLGLWGLAVAWFSKGLPLIMLARVIGVLGVVSAGFILFTLETSNPFARSLPSIPPEGGDLNPLLQDFGLIVHPPTLYMGYVGLSVVFAFAIAALLGGRLDAAWARWSRPWTTAAWVFLTIGIALGSWWAYYELGWGGWWFWDPVENASFMPWLIGAALLHSIIVTEKRGGFSAWTALLAVLAFCFSILGAFLVRSGVLTSVHAFAIDPLRGSILLGGLLAYGGFALGLFAWRAPSLKAGPDWALMSREGALMLNNLVLATATGTVLLGTLFPLIGEAFGEQVSVGEPYFNLTFTPMLALLLVALPLVQAWSWGRLQGPIRPHWFAGAAVLLVGVAVLSQVTTTWPVGALLGIALAIWLIAGSIVEIARRAMRWDRIFKLPRRVWGMSLAHAGLGLFVLGAVVETSGGFERTIALPIGGSTNVAGWTFTLEETRDIEGPNWYADEASLRVEGHGKNYLMTPSKRYYPAARMPTTETSIRRTGLGDLYAALGDRRVNENGVIWTLRVYFNPLIDMVFLGVILIGLGGGLAISGGGRRRKTKPAEAAVA